MLGRKLTGLEFLLAVHAFPDLPVPDPLDGHILSLGDMLDDHLLDLLPELEHMIGDGDAICDDGLCCVLHLLEYCRYARCLLVISLGSKEGSA